MSYQPRLDRLEAEVFNTSVSQPVSYNYILPYILIFVVTLIYLYSFCPDSLRVRRQREYHIRVERFTAVWLVVSVILSLSYYKYLYKYLSFSDQRAD